jgi:hypothetical protein
MLVLENVKYITHKGGEYTRLSYWTPDGDGPTTQHIWFHGSIDHKTATSDDFVSQEESEELESILSCPIKTPGY